MTANFLGIVYVAIVICVLVAREWKYYVSMRHEYLRGEVKKSTGLCIFVEDIPPAYRSDAAFAKFWTDMFGDHVVNAVVLKDVSKVWV